MIVFIDGSGVGGAEGRGRGRGGKVESEVLVRARYCTERGTGKSEGGGSTRPDIP